MSDPDSNLGASLSPLLERDYNENPLTSSEKKKLLEKLDVPASLTSSKKKKLLEELGVPASFDFEDFPINFVEEPHTPTLIDENQPAPLDFLDSELPDLPYEDAESMLNAFAILENTQDPINNVEKTEALKYIEDLISGLHIDERIKNELKTKVEEVLNKLRALKLNKNKTLINKTLDALKTAKTELTTALKKMRKNLLNVDENSAYKQLIDDISAAEQKLDEQKQATKKAKREGKNAKHKKEKEKLKEARDKLEEAKQMVNAYKNYAKTITQLIRKGFRQEQPQIQESEQLDIGRKVIEKPKRRLIDELCGKGKRKGKCGWDKRKTLDDLSRDELMLIIRWIKQAINALKDNDFDHWRDLRRVYNNIRKNAPKNDDDKWYKKTYTYIVNGLLDNEEIQNLDNQTFTINGFINYFNTQPNTEVYNKIYSRCYVYRLISVKNNKTNKTKTIDEKTIDDKYTGRPGDAPVLFLTDIIRNHPEIATPYIHKDLRDVNIFAELEEVDFDDTTNQPKHKVETRQFDINITIQRIKRGKKEEDNEPVLKKNKNPCFFTYQLEGEINEEYTNQMDKDGDKLPNYSARVNYEKLKTTAKGSRKRQICKYNDKEQTPCVPLRRRKYFMNTSMKKWLKREGAVSPVKIARRQKGVTKTEKNKYEKLIEELINEKIIKDDINKYYNIHLVTKWLPQSLNNLQNQITVLIQRIAKLMLEKEKEKNPETELDVLDIRPKLRDKVEKKHPEKTTGPELERKQSLIKQLLYLIELIPKIRPGWDLLKLEKENEKLLKGRKKKTQQQMLADEGIKLGFENIMGELKPAQSDSAILRALGIEDEPESSGQKQSGIIANSSLSSDSKGKGELYKTPPIEENKPPSTRPNSLSTPVPQKLERTDLKKAEDSPVPRRKLSRPKRPIDLSRPRRRSARLAEKQSIKKGGRLRKSNKRVM